MRVIVDTRERAPWTFEAQEGIRFSQGITTVRRKLESGDYSVDGLEDRVAIERKSLDDWVGTVMRERSRFYRELDRLRAFEFRCVIIEASLRDVYAKRATSNANPDSILGFIAEVTVAQRVPVYLGGSRAEAQLLAAAFLKTAEKKLRVLIDGGESAG